jgi:GTP 3',8-cyclase
MQHHQEPLVDTQGRKHTYLRLSVTDRCNLRCSYCRPVDEAQPCPQKRLLSRDEILRLVHIMAGMGVTKVRITGGEPLVRPDIVDIVADVASVPGIKTIAATTNGTLLGNLAGDLRQAGMTHLNVSMDSLRRDHFEHIAGVDMHDRVMKGIEVAQHAGFEALKINVVVIRGVNDDELVDIVRFGIEQEVEVRFIEFMPFRSNGWTDERLVTCEQMRQRLATQYELAEIPNSDGGVAQRYRVEPSSATIGFISSMSHPFCTGCDRLRITSDGKLKTCLFRTPELDLAALFDENADDAVLKGEIQRAVEYKSDARPDVRELQRNPQAEMLLIGG